MKYNTAWDKFFINHVKKILAEKKSVIDVGGGLRISKEKGNCFNKHCFEWFSPYLKEVDYKILDIVPDYNPDILGDIQNLPLKDSSQDAIICIAVLEHVENPIIACREIYRVLKPGGYCFLTVPFLHPYHGKKGYYKDYWRFTKDTIGLLLKNFSKIETQEIRGSLETWINLSPLGRINVLVSIANFLDKILKKKSNQISGFDIFLIK